MCFFVGTACSQQVRGSLDAELALGRDWWWRPSRGCFCWAPLFPRGLGEALMSTLTSSGMLQLHRGAAGGPRWVFFNQKRVMEIETVVVTISLLPSGHSFL